MTKFNLKLAFFTLILVVLTAAISACVKKPSVQPVNQNQNTNTNTATTTSEVDTSDWKTYRNEIIGIEFDYPSDWSEITSEGLKSEDRGDAVWGTFSLDLPDLSHVNHTFIDYDNLSVNEQYEKIKCYEGDVLAVVCEERVNRYGTRYVWLVEETKKVYFGHWSLVIGHSDSVAVLTLSSYILQAHGQRIFFFISVWSKRVSFICGR